MAEFMLSLYKGWSISDQASCMSKSVQTLNNTMAQQDDSYEEDEFWQTYTQAGMHMNPVTTGSMYPPITGPPLQPPVERTLSGSLPITPGDHGPFASYGSPLPFHSSEYGEGSSTAQDFQAVYGTSAPFPSSEQLEDPFATHSFQGQGHSPASASESSLSTSSYTAGPSSRLSTTPAHIAPKERSPSGKQYAVTAPSTGSSTNHTDSRIPIDSIQTVEEARKSRRRAQNRAAQQAFKQRRKKREKELVKEVEQAEQHCKALEAENKELEEELDRKKQERSSSITALSGRSEGTRGAQGQSRSSSQ